MKISAILAALALGPGAMGYVILAYDGSYCTGSATEINVHGNTCRDQNVPDMTRSVRLIRYGAHRQRASLYTADWCDLNSSAKDFWVDGGSVKKDECVNFHAVVRSFASWSR